MATVGPTSPGTSSAPNLADRGWGNTLTFPSAATLDKVTVFFDYDAGNSSGACNAKVVIYADSSGAPGARVAVSSAVAVGSNDQTVDFTFGISVSAATYWFVVVTDDAGTNRLNIVAFSGSSSIRKEGLTYASPADPMGTPDATGAISHGIYATYTVGSTLDQSHFRFRNDDGSETTATWAAAEDTPISLAKNTPVRLRVEIGATGDPANAAYKLQYRKVGDSTWRDIN